MADWRLLAAAGGLVAVLVGGWITWDLTKAPETAGELFRKRCSRCHELPDLSLFRREDMKGIVRTMRTKNGADKVISDAEAAVITEYLEELVGK